MGKAILAGPDIDAGRDLIKALDNAGFPISIAAWLYLKDAYDWQLFIASPDVQTHGPTTVYKFVDRVRSAIGSPISSGSVTVANTTNHFINTLPYDRFPQATTVDGDGPMRFRRGFLQDVDIDDGLIYRIDRSVKPSNAAPKPNAAVLKKVRSLAA